VAVLRVYYLGAKGEIVFRELRPVRAPMWGTRGEPGARASNRGLGQSTIGVQRQSPWSEGQGAKPRKAETFTALECLKEATVWPFLVVF